MRRLGTDTATVIQQNNIAKHKTFFQDLHPREHVSHKQCPALHIPALQGKIVGRDQH